MSQHNFSIQWQQIGKDDVKLQKMTNKHTSIKKAVPMTYISQAWNHMIVFNDSLTKI